MKIHQQNAGHMTKMAAMPIYFYIEAYFAKFDLAKIGQGQPRVII